MSAAVRSDVTDIVTLKPLVVERQQLDGKVERKSILLTLCGKSNTEHRDRQGEMRLVRRAGSYTCVVSVCVTDFLA